MNHLNIAECNSERARMTAASARSFDAWNAEPSPFVTANERLARDGAPWSRPSKIVRGEGWEVGP